jgi:hypothetical protein
MARACNWCPGDTLIVSIRGDMVSPGEGSAGDTWATRIRANLVALRKGCERDIALLRIKIVSVRARICVAVLAG